MRPQFWYNSSETEGSLTGFFSQMCISACRLVVRRPASTHRTNLLSAMCVLVETVFRWRDNIKMQLNEVGRELNSSGSEYGPVVDSYGHCNEPSDYIKEQGISWATNQLVASQGGFCCIELIYATQERWDRNKVLEEPSSPALKMAAICSYETSVYTFKSTWRYKREHEHRHADIYYNL